VPGKDQKIKLLSKCFLPIDDSFQLTKVRVPHSHAFVPIRENSRFK
jgi:hypothetical protein